MSTVLDLHPPSPSGFPPLLARLVDDAGLFPPSGVSVPEVVKAHLAARRAPYAGLIGFLLCPISRLGAVVSALRKARPVRPVTLSLVADTGLGGLPKAISTALDNSKLFDLRMVEVPAPSDVDANWLVQLTEFVPDDVVRVVEPRRGRPEWLSGVRRVAEAGCWPKLRCGGTSVESFPTVEEVADFLAIATGTGAPFKATAGLHHAVRHHDQRTGLTHHGLLNMLIGTAHAISGSSAHEALRCTDAAALAAEASALSKDTSRVVREVFACTGSVSVTDPVTDLTRLGLL
ncbi:MAG TPA: hypothetical protein VFO16_03250 [Pseudonocardiaceae bacterium]|nr:hypothetical protein [Pseudonocardiaceae bacterium]